MPTKFTNYDAATNTVTAGSQGHYRNRISHPAKVKDGVTDKKIPNQATVYYNNC